MHEHLAVTFHQQDTNYYCGAACAQMVLRALGQPLLSQDDLYNDNHNHSVEPAAWASPPDGLCWTMNNRQAQKHFTLDATNAEEPISRTLCWAICHYQCAPIALVYAGNHWVVVRGCTLSAAPASGFDTSYTITGFDINNPWPPVPGPPGPPPHAEGDVCGSGGNRGIADINVSYDTWQRDYLTANVFGTLWQGMFVAVCDPDRPRPPAAPEPSPPPERKRRFAGHRLLEGGLVREDLRENLIDAGLLSHPVWSKVFEDVVTAEPLLVERLDRPGDRYWIAPTVGRDGMLRAAVSVDAYFGDYQQAMAVRNPDASPFGFADSGRALEQVIDRRFEIPGAAGSLLARRQDLVVHPDLVWRPCRESLSPFYPFRMISLGAHPLYVRIFDGAVFMSLTNDRGGL